MKASHEVQDSAVRFSFGAFTTKKAMDELLCSIKEVEASF